VKFALCVTDAGSVKATNKLIVDYFNKKMFCMEAVQTLAVITGLTAALKLFYGSIGVPWTEQSWKGDSTLEQRRKRRQLAMEWIGIPSAVLSALLQLAAVFFE
jgi:hypothetical protein